MSDPSAVADLDRAADGVSPDEPREPPAGGRRGRRRRVRWAALGVVTCLLVALGVVVGARQSTDRSGAYTGPATVNGCVIAPKAACPGVDLSGVDLSGADLSGADLTGAKLVGANLSNARLAAALLPGADLTGATLTWASFKGANLNRATLEGVRGGSVDFSAANLWNARMVGADLPSSIYVETRPMYLDLSGATLTGSVWLRAGPQYSQFAGADLSGAWLNDSAFSNDSFAGARLVGAKMQGSSFQWSDFRNADLTRADLGVVLSGNNREPVLLTRSDFSGANLTEAVMTRVSASEARFIGADFTRADLGRAKSIRPDNVSGAVFSGTRMPNLTTASVLDPKALRYTAAEMRPEIVAVNSRAENYLCGSPPCPDPAFFVTVHSGGTKVDVNIVVTSGCLAFGNQTRTFAVESMDTKPYVRRSTFTWTAGLGSNICSWSEYEVRVRSRDETGVTSAWTDFAAIAIDSFNYVRPCVLCQIVN